MAVVEFALIMPMFLLICLAAVDFGRVFQVAMAITGANRAALAYAGSSGSASTDSSGIAAIVKADASNFSGLTTTTSQFCTCTPGGTQVACSSSCSGKSSYVQVTTTYPFQTAVAWPWVPNSLNVTTSGVMRVQ